MSNKVFDIIVKKMMKYKGRLMDGQKIASLIVSCVGEDFSVQRQYKMLYHLKTR